MAGNIGFRAIRIGIRSLANKNFQPQPKEEKWKLRLREMRIIQEDYLASFL